MTAGEFGYVTPENLPIFTDLYELTMLQGYYRADHNPRATFDLFIRDLPPGRGYLIAAGLEQAVHYIESLTFGDRTLDYLAKQGFGDDFLAALADFTFSGDVRAIPEGRAVFHDEPLIEVTAPIMEAQLLETLLINQISFQTLIATKAARMRDVVERAGSGQSLVDFGSRRAHGTDAGMKAARAAVIGGFDGTSNVAAGEAFDIETFGTMAHSWIQSFPTERAAYEAFVEVYGEDSILLVDTYDTLAGARLAMDVATERDLDIRGVRLDSGDLAALSKEVAPIVGEDSVFVSSGVDEYFLREFFEAGGIATGFGPGTSLTTSADAPKIEGVYKLVSVADDTGSLQPSMKLSAGKVTYPGQKRVTRESDGETYRRDLLGTAEESLPGEDLLVDVIRDGELVYDLPDLTAIQERTLAELERIPEPVRAIDEPTTYPVDVSDGLQGLADRVEAELEAGR